MFVHFMLVADVVLVSALCLLFFSCSLCSVLFIRFLRRCRLLFRLFLLAFVIVTFVSRTLYKLMFIV